LLSLVALVAGTAAASAVSGTVGAAAPSTGSFTAVDTPAWHANGGTDTTATIAAGGTVAFSYPSGGSMHSVVFDNVEPTACTGLPAAPQGSGWSGTCSFSTPSTYAFHCGNPNHPSMTGTVVVEAASTTTTSGSTTSTGSTTAPTSTSGSSTTSPLPSAAVTVARGQKGVVLRGSVTTPAGPSQIVVTALVSNRALAKHRPKRVKQVRVGSQTKRSTGTDKTSFAVKLNTSARRALHRRHRLAVNLRIVVTPQGGPAAARTVAVALRER
jgi:plastocyanin